MRSEEMVFLGMARKPKVKDGRRDPIEQMKDTIANRKLVQKNFMDDFDNAKNELKDDIQDNEGADIEDAMLKERRDWIQQYKALNNNKPPDDLKEFY